MQIFDNTTISLMSKTLDGLWRRQEVTSDNISNYETPNYKAKTVSFEDSLKSALSGSNTKDITDDINNSVITVGKSNDGSERLDGNNVDLEGESMSLVKTTYQYMYSQRVLNDEFSRLRTAITEGSK